MTSPPFDSIEELQQAFAAGLQRLLQNPGLGSYILVHANACFDAEVYRGLFALIEQSTVMDVRF